MAAYRFPICALAIVFAAGCSGGGASSQSPVSSGAITLSIAWPASNRTVQEIPSGTQSIVITIAQTDGSFQMVSSPLTQPSDPTEPAFLDIPVPNGSYILTADAYSNADGTGTILAEGFQNVTIDNVDQNANIILASIPAATVNGTWSASIHLAPGGSCTKAGSGVEAITFIDQNPLSGGDIIGSLALSGTLAPIAGTEIAGTRSGAFFTGEFTHNQEPVSGHVNGSHLIVTQNEYCADSVIASVTTVFTKVVTGQSQQSVARGMQSSISIGTLSPIDGSGAADQTTSLLKL